ncbi:hypothetical protein LTR37_017080 [Vermiconidia calcicola]|uniref:Uncharacterized protein n=1 Tax=Vermiconidia calcicola TaxID=1690605 RepID=A0ACC3ML44_9PEZI|nr:hypothetical protein LTR37_017080 [Vermiconidia calcicola]
MFRILMMTSDAADPLTGAILEIDETALKADPDSTSEVDRELGELHRILVITNVGHSIHQLRNQRLEQADFSAWMQDAIIALEEALGKETCDMRLLNNADCYVPDHNDRFDTPAMEQLGLPRNKKAKETQLGAVVRKPRGGLLRLKSSNADLNKQAEGASGGIGDSGIDVDAEEDHMDID